MQSQPTLEARAPLGLSHLLFKAGDFASSVIIGALAASLAGHVFGPGWHPLAGMAGGMIVGMLAQFLSFLLLLPLLGAFEVMVPSMLSAMLAGMAGGMAPSMGLFPGRLLLLMGAMAGLIAFLWAELADWRLRGESHVGF